MLRSCLVGCAFLALFLTACNDSRPQSGLSLSNATPPLSLIRLPREGGHARIYRLPRLEPAEWPTEGEFPTLRRAIGADLDQRLVFASGTDNQIVALDLENGKVRTYLTGARQSVLGPDGVLYAVDDSLRVTRIARRTPTRFPGRLQGQPRDLFGTQQDELLAVIPGSPTRALLLSSDQPQEKQELPAGASDATMWGDLLAIAADSAVVLYTPRLDTPLRSIRVDGHATSVRFSPSGHRIYVGRREPGLVEIDRFGDRVLRDIDLPGPAATLRVDHYGRWLLVRPADADSVWLVNTATGKLEGEFVSRWDADLPVVAGGAWLLLNQGGDLVARNLDDPAQPETGRVRNGASDLWLPVAWTPERGTRIPTAMDTTPEPTPADSGEPAQVFLQVSSSQNPSWAQDLADRLREAGLPASVLKPGHEGDPYRVVLGPYDSREAAEAEGRRLGRPFFIYQPGRP